MRYLKLYRAWDNVRRFERKPCGPVSVDAPMGLYLTPRHSRKKLRRYNYWWNVYQKWQLYEWNQNDVAMLKVTTLKSIREA